MKGASERLIREHNERAWLAWHTAQLTAYAPAKGREFIKLEKLLRQSETHKQHRQSAEQQLAIAKSWMASRRR
jgi:hypothetical protein